MNKNLLLTEELFRIQEIMFNKNKKTLLTEQLWVALANTLDNFLSSGSRFADNAVEAAAQAVRTARGATARSRAVNNFVRSLTNSAADSSKLDNLVTDMFNNLDNVSSRNIRTADNAMDAIVKDQGSITDDILRRYEQQLDDAIQVDSALQPLKQRFIQNQVQRWRGATGVGERTAGAERQLRVAGGTRSAQAVLDNVNSAIPAGRPKLTMSQLEEANQGIDDLVRKYENGEISNTALEAMARRNADNLQTFADKAPSWIKNWLAGEGLVATIIGSIGKGFKGIASAINMKNFKIFLLCCLIGAAIAGLYVGWNAFNDNYLLPRETAKVFTEADADCLSTIKGWGTLNADQIKELGTITIDGEPIGCKNTATDAPDNIKIVSIGVIPGTKADPRTGFILSFRDGNKMTVYANKNYNYSGTETEDENNVSPSGCKWKTESEAREALKGSFGDVPDEEIRVDLSACLVYYTPPGFTTEQSYAPGEV